MLISEVIKLGQTRSDNTDSFMKEYYELTQPHPFNNRARIYGHSVLEVYPILKEIHISDIMTMSPQSGAGTQALQMLTGLADKHRVILDGLAKAYSRDSRYITDTEQLVKWYIKHGFVVDDEFVDDPSDLEGYEEINIKYYPK